MYKLEINYNMLANLHLLIQPDEKTFPLMSSSGLEHWNREHVVFSLFTYRKVNS